MDNEWAIGQLETFIAMTGPHPAGKNGYIDTWYHAAADRDTILPTLGVVRQILNNTTPGWERAHLVHSEQEFGQMRDAALEARALLSRSDEIAAHLDSPAPTLSADSLHPWVWEPARPLWRDGHYRAAVQTAATGLDARLQDFAGRHDTSGTDLVNQCLTDAATKPGKPRLRVPNQGNEQTTRSVQDGLRSLGVAAFQFARNPASHRIDDMAEQEALEIMALLSLFARTVQTCQVATAEDR